jgi:hypothetical protein
MAIRCLYWDKHGDEWWRVKTHLAAVGVDVKRFESVDPPTEGDVFFIHEGEWLERVPVAMRPRCVLSLCIVCRPQNIAYFKGLGFQYALFKHDNHAAAWAYGAFTLPPLCPARPVSSGTGDVVSLISNWSRRDNETFQFARQIEGLRMYGEGDQQLGDEDDFGVLATAR